MHIVWIIIGYVSGAVLFGIVVGGVFRLTKEDNILTVDDETLVVVGSIFWPIVAPFLILMSIGQMILQIVMRIWGLK